MKHQPLQYQLDALAQTRGHVAAGRRSVVISALMGAGKTAIGFLILKAGVDRGSRGLFLCDRRMLVKQAADDAWDWDLHVGQIMAGKGLTPDAPVQCVSKQTLDSWAVKQDRIELPPADILIEDECHRANDRRTRALRERYPNAVRVGLSATPVDEKGNGLSRADWGALVQTVMPSELIAMGRCVPSKVFVPHIPDLKGCARGKDGDYSPRALAMRLNRKNLIGDVVGWWRRLAENKPSIYYGCDVAHSVDLQREFLAAGVPAGLIYASTSDQERDSIHDRMESGELKVVVNCDVMAEGINWPFVEVVGLVRPTRRYRRFLQMAGRMMRSHGAKTEGILIDHSGAALYHGYPDADVTWELGDGFNVDKVNREAKEKGEARWVRCPECSLMFRQSKVCPHCGYTVGQEVRGKRPFEVIDTRNGTLVELDRLAALTPEELGREKQRFWLSCIGMAVARDMHAGMAATMFKQRFKQVPWDAGVGPLPQGDGWRAPAKDVFPEFTPDGRRKRRAQKAVAAAMAESEAGDE